jgi:thiamine-phosphate pyrophosphorylase
MIIAVTNRSLCEDNFIQRVRNLIDSGVYGVYLREKDLNQKDYETLALKISEGSKKYLSRFILCNPDSAKIIGVQNIQVSMEFVKNNEAPPVGLRTGVSVHSIDEAITAERWGADYITAGHIFVTDCKKDIPPRGLDFLREVCQFVKIPVFAIGGINESNWQSVLNCGAAGFCLMSELMKCSKPETEIQKYK